MASQGGKGLSQKPISESISVYDAGSSDSTCSSLNEKANAFSIGRKVQRIEANIDMLKGQLNKVAAFSAHVVAKEVLSEQDLQDLSDGLKELENLEISCEGACASQERNNHLLEERLRGLGSRIKRLSGGHSVVEKEMIAEAQSKLMYKNTRARGGGLFESLRVIMAEFENIAIAFQRMQVRVSEEQVTSRMDFNQREIKVVEQEVVQIKRRIDSYSDNLAQMETDKNNAARVKKKLVEFIKEYGLVMPTKEEKVGKATWCIPMPRITLRSKRKA